MSPKKEEVKKRQREQAKINRDNIRELLDALKQKLPSYLVGHNTTDLLTGTLWYIKKLEEGNPHANFSHQPLPLRLTNDGKKEKSSKAKQRLPRKQQKFCSKPDPKFFGKTSTAAVGSESVKNQTGNWNDDFSMLDSEYNVENVEMNSCGIEIEECHPCAEVEPEIVLMDHDYGEMEFEIKVLPIPPSGPTYLTTLRHIPMDEIEQREEISRECQKDVSEMQMMEVDGAGECFLGEPRNEDIFTNTSESVEKFTGNNETSKFRDSSGEKSIPHFFIGAVDLPEEILMEDCDVEYFVEVPNTDDAMEESLGDSNEENSLPDSPEGVSGFPTKMCIEDSEMELFLKSISTEEGWLKDLDDTLKDESKVELLFQDVASEKSTDEIDKEIETLKDFYLKEMDGNNNCEEMTLEEPPKDKIILDASKRGVDHSTEIFANDSEIEEFIKNSDLFQNLEDTSLDDSTTDKNNGSSESDAEVVAFFSKPWNEVHTISFEEWMFDF